MRAPRPLTPEQRELLADYLARRTPEAADEAWDRNAWSDEEVERPLRGHDRRHPA